MRYTQLGKSDMEVSILALGCWAFEGGGQWGPQDDQDSIHTVHAALDLGVNIFDTAPAYGGGKSEEVLGQALKGRREQAIIADKVSKSDLSRENVIASCETSLKLLQTDYIDLLQIHWPDHDIPLEETLSALQQLQQEEKIRAIGVCNYGPLDLEDYLRSGVEMVSNQLPYSLLWRAIEFDIIEKCQQKNVGILAYSPLLHGLLSGKYSNADDMLQSRARTKHFDSKRGGRHGQAGYEELTFATIAKIREICQEIDQPMHSLALAWLCHQPSVFSVLAGARNVEQLQGNVKSVELVLDGDILKQLNNATEELKQAFGHDPDMWATDSRFR